MVLFKNIFWILLGKPIWNGKQVRLYEQYNSLRRELPNGRIQIGMFNIRYERFKFKQHFQWCLRLRVVLNGFELNELGLPLSYECLNAYNIEKYYMRTVPEQGPAQYIGHCFNDGIFDIYWYVHQPNKIAKYLEADKKRNNSNRKYVFDIKHDPKWKIIEPLLDYSNGVFIPPLSMVAYETLK